MENESEEFEEINLDSLTNEFTGGLRESILPPEPTEPICLISYELTYILLNGGPDCRKSFWKTYRRELKINKDTDYKNYHVKLCRHQLVSLRMNPNHPVYFRNKRLTIEKEADAFMTQALLEPRFN